MHWINKRIHCNNNSLVIVSPHPNGVLFCSICTDAEEEEEEEEEGLLTNNE